MKSYTMLFVVFFIIFLKTLNVTNSETAAKSENDKVFVESGKTEDDMRMDTASRKTPESHPKNLEHYIELLNRTNAEDLSIATINDTINTCQIGAKNNVTTRLLPDQHLHERWRKQNVINDMITMRYGELRLISAFVYSDFVAVVFSMYGRENSSLAVTCQYFDCNHNHIGSYDSRIYPISAVRCVRKFGAEFISITVAGEDASVRDPIQIIDRTATQPPHLIGVCAGQVYGNETRFVDIVESVEHHRMMGATMFYLTIFDADEPLDRVVWEYQRLGLMEATYVNLEFSQITFDFHPIQVADCYYRSRMHSKWVINLDIDERFFMKSPTNLPKFLENLPVSPEIVGLTFQVARIKVEDPGILSQEERFFEKYRVQSRPMWINLKCIYQHQYAHVPFFHFPWRISPTKRIMHFNSTIGYFRHYRLVSATHIGANWVDLYSPFSENSMDPEFARNLKSRISRKLSYLFDKHYIKCDSIIQSDFTKSDYIGQGYKCV